jgi:hypothetical protein
MMKIKEKAIRENGIEKIIAWVQAGVMRWKEVKV